MENSQCLLSGFKTHTQRGSLWEGYLVFASFLAWGQKQLVILSCTDLEPIEGARGTFLLTVASE